MLNKTALIVSLKLAILSIIFAAIWFMLNRSEVPQQAQDRERVLPIQVHQLSPRFRDRVLLRCENATLSSANEIKTLSCVLTNNSSKHIIAGALSISFLLADNGTTNPQPELLCFDTFLNPDFREEHPDNLIAPGAEYRLQDMPTSFDRRIASIVAFLDYIEFSDGTTVGPDNGGSRTLNSQREGARKYKNWLAAKYEQKQSIDAIVPLLDHDNDLPSELGITDPNEEQGARIFRRQERRVYETKGAEVLIKHLRARH